MVCVTTLILLLSVPALQHVVAKTEIEKGLGMHIQIISIACITVLACCYNRLRYCTY